MTHSNPGRKIPPRTNSKTFQSGTKVSSGPIMQSLIKLLCVLLSVSNLVSGSPPNMDSFPFPPPSSTNISLLCRQPAHCNVLPFPPKPECSKFLPISGKTSVISVNLWKIDTKDTSSEGIIGWMEEITTSCWYGFWGDSDRRILSTSSVPYTDTFTETQVQKIKNSPLNSPIILHQSNKDLYAWYWLRERELTTKITYGMRVTVLRNPAGDIRSPIGSWELQKDGVYRTNLKILQIITVDSPSACPVVLFKVVPAVMTAPPHEASIVSIPTMSLQFSLRMDLNHLFCIKDSIKIFRSMGGYLISLLSIKGEPLQSVHDINKDELFFHNPAVLKHPLSEHTLPPPTLEEQRKMLKDTFDYASYRYESAFLLAQENHNLQTLHFSICQMRSLSWGLLTPPDLAGKIASFYSGTKLSWGQQIGLSFRVCELIPVSFNCTPIRPLKLRKGLLGVSIKGQEFWMEPLTGHVYQNLTSTLAGALSTLIPIYPHGYWDLQHGTLIIGESHTEELEVLHQATAHNLPTLYSATDYSSEDEPLHTLLPQSVSGTQNYWFWKMLETVPSNIKVGVLLLLIILATPITLNVLMPLILSIHRLCVIELQLTRFHIRAQ